MAGMANELLFYTPGVRPDDLGALKGQLFSDPNLAVSQLLRGLPTQARVLLIPEGPYTFARLAGDQSPEPVSSLA